MKKKLSAGLLAVSALFYSLAGKAVAPAESMPDCSFSSLLGSPAFDLQKYKGKVIYVDFWASWCGPCAQSFPFLNTLHHEFKDQGLQIVGVNLDEEKPLAEAFLAKYPATFTVVSDSGAVCAEKFAVQGMPSSYLIDRAGIVRHVHLGFHSAEAPELHDLVRQLLKP